MPSENSEKHTKENNNTEIALLAKDVGYISRSVDEVKKSIGEIQENMKNDYISRAEFDPIKNIVYGMVSIILVGVIGAIVALVIK